MSEEQVARARMDRLVRCIERLAAPAGRQVEYLDGLGVAPMADELGLEFDDVYRPLESLLVNAPELATAAARLRELDEMLGRDGLGWTVEDLRVSAEWAEVRVLAAGSLNALGR